VALHRLAVLGVGHPRRARPARCERSFQTEFVALIRALIRGKTPKMPWMLLPSRMTAS
jgi:hypothetical protein